MGAWGPGLRANDDALDAIGHYEKRLNGIKRTKKAKLRLKKTEVIFAEMIKAKDRFDDAASILGVADWLLDVPVPLCGIECVKKALEYELTADRMDCWVDEDDRREALSNFQLRLEGKKVNKSALALDNAGLFARMGNSNAEMRGEARGKKLKPKPDILAKLINRLEEAQSLLTSKVLIPGCVAGWQKIAEEDIKQANPEWKTWPR